MQCIPFPTPILIKTHRQAKEAIEVQRRKVQKKQTMMNHELSITQILIKRMFKNKITTTAIIIQHCHLEQKPHIHVCLINYLHEHNLHGIIKREVAL